jgi:peptidoglycan/xylan/chitin deacetylase (PgdA/CDA1 family)/SAM-dependent methyltransferase
LSHRLTAVIPSLPLGQSIHQLIEGLRTQVGISIQILLLQDPELNRLSARDTQLLAEDEETVVRSAKGCKTLANARNRAVGFCRSEYIFFYDEGYRFTPKFFEQALGALDGDGGLAYATARLRAISTAGEESILTPVCEVSACDLNPDIMHWGTVFRRKHWDRQGGCDPKLHAFEGFELWLRLHGDAGGGRLLEETLVERRTTNSNHHYRNLARDRYLPAMQAIFRKHRELFLADPASVLNLREEEMNALSARQQRLLEVRSTAAERLEELETEIAQLSKRLAEDDGMPVVDWGDLRRVTPISADWGYDRGLPVDRYYIEKFLEDNAKDIHGIVLEVQEPDYTLRYGGDNVRINDVVDLNRDNPRANIFADLRQPSALVAESYDCIIITQTLHVIDDMPAVIAELYRLLKPGGTLLATFPCLSRVCLEYGPAGDFWRVTEAGARLLLEGAFEPGLVQTDPFGNVLVGTAFSYGLSCAEISEEEFDSYDPYNPVLIGVRATKAKRIADQSHRIETAEADHYGAILGYHRIVEAACLASGNKDIHDICVDPRLFREQLAYLTKHYTLLPLDELASLAHTGRLPANSVALSFDDGYLDMLNIAAPILAEFKVPATFFISTARMNDEVMYWWDLLEKIFFGKSSLPNKLEIQLGQQPACFSLDAAEQVGALHWQLYRILVKSPPATRDNILRELCRWSDTDPLPQADQRPLKANELLQLAAHEHHSIGAHGVHHLALSQHDLETRRQEITQSKTALERLLGKPVQSFAYAHGDLCPEAVELVRSASYRWALSCEMGVVSPRSDPFQLPRLMVDTQAVAAFDTWIDQSFAEAAKRLARN